ncbi:TonB-dependent receptor [Phenylobacterium sp.]|uniref:TonB-dependent receptor n=1 Tax=Phenylobacterium sp. TaxID=1871053 RepID=UPI002F3F2C32
MDRRFPLKTFLLASLAIPALLAGPARAETAAAAVGHAADAVEGQAEAVSGTDAMTTVNEILVTARRQTERAQDVPIPLTAISGSTLEEKGAYTLEDIQRQAPSFTAYNSNPRNSSVSIRGIGISSAADGLDNSVGIYFDNIYLGRPGMALADLIDIDSFEILRGPQGTLFGRNSSAGVVNVTTRKPSFSPAATAEASIGNYHYNQLRFSLTGPLVDDLVAFRLTGFNTHRGGVLENTKTGVDANSVGRSGARAQLLITPSTKLSIRLSGDVSQEDDSCCVSVLSRVIPTSLGGAGEARTLAAFAALGYTPQASLDSTQNNAIQDMRTDQKGLSAEVNWDLGPVTFTSITGWRYWHFDPLQDSDSTPLDIIQVNVARTRDWQYSQEFRVASKPGRFNWQGGAFLFEQRLKDHYILNQFGYDAGAFYTALARQTNPNAAAVSIAPGSQYIDDTTSKSTSWAVFGQANYQVTDKLILTGGVRYTKDKRSGVTNTSTLGTPYGPTSIPFNYDVTVEGDNVSYLGAAAYKLTPDNLVYVSYSTGYKSAGLNLNAAVSAGSPLILDPERVKNWEIGTKNSFFHRRVTLNLSAFDTRLSGLQANIALPGIRSFLANVGDVRARGVEAEGTWNVTNGLTLSAAASYNDAHYTSYPNAPCPVGKTAPCDLTGARLFQSPKWIANLGARYEWQVNEEIRPYALVSYSYRSSQLGSVQADPLTRIAPYSLVNARLGAKLGERYDVSVWVDNAFDETYFQSSNTTAVVGASAYGVTSRLGTPRTFGATLRADF